MFENIFTIRKASFGDIEQVAWLLDQLWYQQTVDDLRAMFKLYVSSDQYDLVVAEKSGNVVGFVAYSLTKIFVSGKTRFHIEGLVVDSKHRRSGIGKLLMKYIENAAQKFSPCVIDLVSRVSRSKEGSHDFYKSIGYQCSADEAKLYFRKDIV